MESPTFQRQKYFRAYLNLEGYWCSNDYEYLYDVFSKKHFSWIATYLDLIPQNHRVRFFSMTRRYFRKSRSATIEMFKDRQMWYIDPTYVAHPRCQKVVTIPPEQRIPIEKHHP